MGHFAFSSLCSRLLHFPSLLPLERAWTKVALHDTCHNNATSYYDELPYTQHNDDKEIADRLAQLGDGEHRTTVAGGHVSNPGWSNTQGL